MYPETNVPTQLLLSEVAGAVGHSVNNLAAYLFSAADQLDEPSNSGDFGSIKNAVGAACLAATSLGAALHLLSLHTPDCKMLKKFGQAISDSRLAESISAAAIDRARLERFEEWPEGVVLATADTDTIKAAFICAAAYLGKIRMDMPELTYSTHLSKPSEGKTCRICIDLNGKCDQVQNKARHSHCPFELALRSLAAVEEEIGMRVLFPDKNRLRIEVDARIIDPIQV